MTLKFFLDHMLGRLARWVRFMGYHAKYASADMTDGEIADLCNSSSLLLLSRDRELCSRVEESMFIKSADIDGQLRQFISEYGPNRTSMMRICPECDGDLIHAGKESVIGKVADGVLRNATKFWRCETCGKIYWNGTHYSKIIRKISELTGAGHES